MAKRKKRKNKLSRRRRSNKAARKVKRSRKKVSRRRRRPKRASQMKRRKPKTDKKVHGTEHVKKELIQKIINLGKAKGKLTYDQVNEMLPQTVVSPKEIEEIFAILSKEKIDVVGAEDATPTPEPTKETKESEDEERRLDELARVSRVDDPVRMYLRQMGQISLLTREEELKLAQKIEAAEERFKVAVLECRASKAEFLSILEEVIEQRISPEEYFEEDIEAKNGKWVSALRLVRNRLRRVKRSEDPISVILRTRPTTVAIDRVITNIRSSLQAIERMEREIEKLRRREKWLYIGLGVSALGVILLAVFK